MSNLNPVVLIILDGWGYREDPAHNAIAAAHTPQWNQWWQTCPHILLNASGTDVGLPDGQMGNSEVGHMHIGAGRQVLQDLTFINDAIEHNTFANNTVLVNMITDMQQTKHAIHVMGLLSPGGVHSHQEHLFAFLSICEQLKFSNVYLHLFLDGRDTPPKQAQDNIKALQETLKHYPVATIASISGRYWAMDRDKRWPRIATVYNLLTEGYSEQHFESAEAAIDAYYTQGLSDEFIPPTRIGQPVPITSGDTVFYFNFRADRAKQLTQAFIDPNFKGFERHVCPKLAAFVSMTSYDEALPTQVVFPQRTLHSTLGEVIAKSGLSQLRIAETEKYAHVTFFFNGGSLRKFAQEDRLLIPSPNIKTYDLQPEMSAPALTAALIEAIESHRYDVIICNYANADMVGHSGDFNATVLAIEAIDQALYAVGLAIKEAHGHLFITADHGNAECMFDNTTNQAHTAHTCQPVPLVYVGDPERYFKPGPGTLIDVAPTLLSLLNIPAPKEMTGHVLWADHHAHN